MSSSGTRVDSEVYHSDTNGSDLLVNAASLGDAGATPLSAEDKTDHIAAINFLCAWMQTWITRSIVKLGVCDILDEVPKKSLSVEKIISQLECKNRTNAITNLDRMMRFLACRGFFTDSVNENKETEYGLNRISRMFVTDCELSVVPWSQILAHKSTIRPLEVMHEAVLKDVSPWEFAHGLPVYAANPNFPDFGDVFHKSMTTNTNYLSRILAEEYEGFRDAKTLVDVGGSVGNSLSVILKFHPHLRGINFDLPSVVAAAPGIPGVEHVGGSFFDCVPSGDLIMLSNILHNNTDENCVKILKTVHKAVPDDGKMIIIDHIMSKESTVKAERVRILDMIMLSLFRGGLERTLEQYQALCKAAGFPRCRVIRMSGPADVIEAYKKST